jgi:integrase
MSLVTNVFRRGGSYYFRTRVPARFRALLERRELWRSLRTTHARTARLRASVVHVLTEALWRDLERLMSSTSRVPSAAEIQAMIDQWLKAQLDEDALLRRRTEQDREGAWYAGVIMEPSADGLANRVVETLDEEQLHALLEASRDEQETRCGSPRRLVTDVNEVHLQRGLRHQVFEGSFERHRAGDTTVAKRHVLDLFEREGVSVSQDSDAFDDATRQMVRAHRELLEATHRRDAVTWRPGLDEDPAEEMVSKLDVRHQAEVVRHNSKPPRSRRAGMALSRASEEAILALSKSGEWRPKREPDYRTAVATFILWHGEDPLVGDVTREMAGDFQVALGSYPTNPNKRPLYNSVLSFAARQARAVEINDEKLLSPTTINSKYLGPLRGIFDWLALAGSGLENPFKGISARVPKHKDLRASRRDFTVAELQRFFDLPVFTGALATEGSGVARPGSEKIRDWRFWVPLICIFSGMRLNEVCGLALQDVKIDHGIAYFHVRDDAPGQSLKANASRRKVPIHPELLSLGIIEQVQAWRDQGRRRLFDELKLDSKGYFSSKPSRRFGAMISRIADADPDEPGQLVFHSMRHTVTTRLRAADVRKDIAEDLVGHDSGDTHSGYGTVDLPTLKAAVDKIVYPGLDLSRLG